MKWRGEIISGEKEFGPFSLKERCEETHDSEAGARCEDWLLLMSADPNTRPPTFYTD